MNEEEKDLARIAESFMAKGLFKEAAVELSVIIEKTNSPRAYALMFRCLWGSCGPLAETRVPQAYEKIKEYLRLWNMRGDIEIRSKAGHKLTDNSLLTKEGQAHLQRMRDFMFSFDFALAFLEMGDIDQAARMLNSAAASIHSEERSEEKILVFGLYAYIEELNERYDSAEGYLSAIEKFGPTPEIIERIKVIRDRLRRKAD